MTYFCSVIGCGKRKERDDNAFFHLPSVPKRCTPIGLVKLRKIRRMKWILALRRSDLTKIKLKYAVVCNRHFISGHPADDYDTENPDWVPSINMSYPVKKQKRIHNLHISKQELQKDSKSPHIEYLRTSIVSQNEMNEISEGEHSSVSIDTTERNLEDDSDASTGAESDSEAYQPISSSVEQNTSSSEQCVSDGEISSPEEFIANSRMVTSDETHACKDVLSSEENTADKHFLAFSGFTNNEMHQNMQSKEVQTLLTMNDIDKVHDIYNTNIAEINKLKAKLKSLTEDILHLNEIYC